jgi:hypothetical protein
MTEAASITVRVPLTIWRRPGRKTVITPEGAATPAPTRPRADPALVKTLARAHRWKRLLEEGRYASISELSTAEKLDRGYLGRVLQLTLLATDIVEAILDGTQPRDLGLPALRRPIPALWTDRRLRRGTGCASDDGVQEPRRCTNHAAAGPAPGPLPVPRVEISRPATQAGDGPCQPAGNATGLIGTDEEDGIPGASHPSMGRSSGPGPRPLRSQRTAAAASR